MKADKLTVSFGLELGTVVRAAARHQREAVSAWLAVQPRQNSGARRLPNSWTTGRQSMEPSQQNWRRLKPLSVRLGRSLESLSAPQL